MSKTGIVIISIFCLIMSGIIIGNGYTTYTEYSADKTTAEIGTDILEGIDNKAEGINTTASLVNGLVTWISNIPTFFTTTLPGMFNGLGDRINGFFIGIWEAIEEFFQDIFNFFNPDDDFDYGGDGYGGGGGGAR